MSDRQVKAEMRNQARATGRAQVYWNPEELCVRRTQENILRAVTTSTQAATCCQWATKE